HFAFGKTLPFSAFSDFVPIGAYRLSAFSQIACRSVPSPQKSPNRQKEPRQRRFDQSHPYSLGDSI
ncbi:MAG: hypothetical protein ACLTQI_06495, partial [Slackia sp.]